MSERIKVIAKLLSVNESQQDELNRQQNRLRKEAVELQTEHAELAFGFKIGCIIRTRKGLLRVSRMDVSWYPRTLWLYGNPIKKDGTFSKAERSAYSDFTIEPTPPPAKR